MKTRTLAGLSTLVLVAGCAAAPTKVSLGETSPQVLRTAQPSAITGNLYAKSPGSQQLEGTPPRGVVAFEAVAPDQRCVAAEPKLAGPLDLAVAFVADGRLVDDPLGLLALGGRLADDREVRAVLALSWPRIPEVGLGELAARARRDERRLLLVEIRAGGDREGFLVDASRNTLLARFPSHGVDVTSAATDPPTLRERLGAAFARSRP